MGSGGGSWPLAVALTLTLAAASARGRIAWQRRVREESVFGSRSVRDTAQQPFLSAAVLRALPLHVAAERAADGVRGPQSTYTSGSATAAEVVGPILGRSRQCEEEQAVFVAVVMVGDGRWLRRCSWVAVPCPQVAHDAHVRVRQLNKLAQIMVCVLARKTRHLHRYSQLGKSQQRSSPSSQSTHLVAQGSRVVRVTTRVQWSGARRQASAVTTEPLQRQPWHTHEPHCTEQHSSARRSSDRRGARESSRARAARAAAHVQVGL